MNIYSQIVFSPPRNSPLWLYISCDHVYFFSILQEMKVEEENVIMKSSPKWLYISMG